MLVRIAHIFYVFYLAKHGDISLHDFYERRDQCDCAYTIETCHMQCDRSWLNGKALTHIKFNNRLIKKKNTDLFVKNKRIYSNNLSKKLKLF